MPFDCVPHRAVDSLARVYRVGLEEGRGRAQGPEKTLPDTGGPRPGPASGGYRSPGVNRVPHVPASRARGCPDTDFPACGVPVAASFPTTSADVDATFLHATAVVIVMPRVSAWRPLRALGVWGGVIAIDAAVNASLL